MHSSFRDAKMWRKNICLRSNLMIVKMTESRKQKLSDYFKLYWRYTPPRSH